MNGKRIFESCRSKQLKIKGIFADCTTPQSKYEKIIALGRTLPFLSPELMTDSRLVKGCQSRMYLHSIFSEGKMQFLAHSDALISSGLAALLIAVYSDESPEAVLTCPPDFLEELEIHQSLSPSRSNGLSSLFLRMKQDALKFLTSAIPLS